MAKVSKQIQDDRLDVCCAIPAGKRGHVAASPTAEPEIGTDHDRAAVYAADQTRPEGRRFRGEQFPGYP